MANNSILSNDTHLTDDDTKLLICSETLDLAPTSYLSETSFSPDVSEDHKDLLWKDPDEQPPADQSNYSLELKTKRKYKSYSNDDKISFLKIAEKVGKKKAAVMMKISWSTAKTWIKKDENLKQMQNTYTQQLLCKFETNF